MMWWTAIVFGLLGSLHCMGMCGPIALAIPIGSGSKFSRYSRFFIYNFGRVLAYSSLGLLFGLLGTSLQMAGFQQTISIIAGMVIILSVIVIYYLPRQKRLGFISQAIQKPFAKFFGKKTYFSVLMIGVLNGLLPCGLVYLALAGATAQASAINGMLYMALFGLGTFPAMFALKISSEIISTSLRLEMRKWVPVLTFLIGVLFVVRGLGLGIPYLSPEFVKTTNEKGEVIEKAECCSKSTATKNKEEKSCCKKDKTCH